MGSEGSRTCLNKKNSRRIDSIRYRGKTERAPTDNNNNHIPKIRAANNRTGYRERTRLDLAVLSALLSLFLSLSTAFPGIIVVDRRLGTGGAYDRVAQASQHNAQRGPWNSNASGCVRCDPVSLVTLMQPEIYCRWLCADGSTRRRRWGLALGCSLGSRYRTVAIDWRGHAVLDISSIDGNTVLSLSLSFSYSRAPRLSISPRAGDSNGIWFHIHFSSLDTLIRSIGHEDVRFLARFYEVLFNFPFRTIVTRGPVILFNGSYTVGCIIGSYFFRPRNRFLEIIITSDSVFRFLSSFVR